MMKLRAIVGLLMLSGATFGAQPRVRVMILDGESAGTYHDWQKTTPVLEKVLDETSLFEVTVVTTPAVTGELTTFNPRFNDFNAVVMNYDAPDERWPASLRAIWRVERCSRVTPAWRSSWRMCWLTAEGVMPSCRAAAVMLPACTTAANTAMRLRSSMPLL